MFAAGKGGDRDGHWLNDMRRRRSENERERERQDDRVKIGSLRRYDKR